MKNETSHKISKYKVQPPLNATLGDSYFVVKVFINLRVFFGGLKHFCKIDKICSVR